MTYKGQSANVTGINVQTLEQRIGAITSSGIVYIYGDEVIASRIGISNKTVTLNGISSEHKITGGTSNGGNAIFLLQSGSNLIFSSNITLDGNGMSRFSPLVDIQGGGVFTMKDGSKITGNINTSDGGAVGVGGTFNMEGGIITGNNSSGTGRGGGVSIGQNAMFNMSGGSITANSAWQGGEYL